MFENINYPPYYNQACGYCELPPFTHPNSRCEKFVHELKRWEQAKACNALDPKQFGTGTTMSST